MERRYSPSSSSSFDSPASFSLSDLSTTLAQKIRAAKKTSAAPEEEEKALEKAKTERLDSYLRKTAPGIEASPTVSSTKSVSNLTSASLDFLESLSTTEFSSSSSSSRRGSTHSSHSSSIPESRHSVTPLMSRRNMTGGGGGGGARRGADVRRRTPVSSLTSASSLTLHSLSLSSPSSSSSSNANPESSYVTKSTLPPPHLRRFPGSSSSSSNFHSSGIVRLAPADHEGFSALRRLLRTLFQTDYNDNFFRDVREAAKYSRLALIDGKAVGAVACKVQENADGDRFRPLEVMIAAMGVLQENRKHGIGTKLLHHVSEAAYKNDQIGRIRLAVHKDNSSAIRLYEKIGFQQMSSSHDVWTMALELRASRF